MGSDTALTVLFAFSTVFCCLEHLEAAAKIQTSPSPLVGLAGAAFLPAVLTTFALTLLLLFTYVRALGRANAAGGAGGRFVGRVAKATLAATVASLLAGAVLQLAAADGYLGGADDVGWVYTK